MKCCIRSKPNYDVLHFLTETCNKPQPAESYLFLQFMSFTPDHSNPIFTLAADLVNNTAQHIFLTGKAGTGKTTFLKYIKENTAKSMVVVAPTGVAAINAAGVTMHSFFQLPFGPFIPGTKRGFGEEDGITDKHTLFKQIRFSSDKRELLNELELLVIDEVSMVRADMLDAMDAILRYFRKRPLMPFGGVQVVYIGDMYQLPPVVPDSEWQLLKDYYETPFFFSAKAIAETAPLYVELKKIYRQNEQRFIDILNRVRNNQTSNDDLELLNKLYKPGFTPPPGKKYITLTTHNSKADTINNNELKKLTAQAWQFKGIIEGDFSEKALPTELNLQLKEGAQVMFVKNDSGPEKKYYNGKLAIIKEITKEKIMVGFDTGEADLELKKETWRNIRYTFNKAENAVDEEELGSFTQYPIRLAWAITIHKSQGLTFERAVIDAGQSFAAGQVYVALSRCTSMEELVLYSRILPQSIATDERIIAFAKKEADAGQLKQVLESEKYRYWGEMLIQTFDLSKLVTLTGNHHLLVQEKKLPDIAAAIELSTQILQKATTLSEVADKFRQQLNTLLIQVRQNNDTNLLKERVTKAVHYFADAIGKELLQPLQQHLESLQHASRVRKYTTTLGETIGAVAALQQKLIHAHYGELIFCEDRAQYEMQKPPEKKAAIKKEKAAKGDSHKESLALFKEGKTIEEIAKMRVLTVGTIAGHLAFFVRLGELDIHELVTEEKISLILPLVKELGPLALTPIKERLDDAVTYGDIRAVANYFQWMQEKEEV
jgi:PIF1-like helicase/Helix-turn-helix domain/Helicase